MSATEIIQALPKLTDAERRQVFDKLLDLEDVQMSEADEALVESRLAAHHANPESSVPLDERKRRLRSQSQSVIRLSQEDAQKVLSLLNDPPRPNKRLKDAVKICKGAK